MKSKFLIIIALTILGLHVNAQNKNSKHKRPYAKTLFSGNDNIVHGGYGTFSLMYKTFDNYSVFVTGGRGAWLINHTYSIGLAGYGIISNTEKESSSEINTYYTGGFGGLFLETILFSKNLLNVSIPIEFGGGKIIKMENLNNKYRENGVAITYIKPGVELDLNVTTGFKISLGAYYMFNSKVDTSQNLKSDLLKGFSGGLQFKWGIF